MIEITVEYAGKHMDLRVPGGVTFHRLAQLIRAGSAAKGTVLPEELSLVFQDKALAVSMHDTVSSFGTGNGDRLQLVAERVIA